MFFLRRFDLQKTFQDWVIKFFNEGEKMINRITSQKFLNFLSRWTKSLIGGASLIRSSKNNTEYGIISGEKNMIRLLMITMALCSLLHAEDVALSGTVKDPSGNALEGVTVKLAKTGGLSMVTKTDGAFTLTNATNVLQPKDLNASYGFTFRNNAIVFTSVSEKISGKISLYSINGKLITSLTLNNLLTGQQTLALPSRLNSGSYVLAGILNGKSFTRSLICTGNERFKSKATAEKAKGTGSFTLKKTAAAKVVVDTLVFSKDGYNNQRWPLNSFSKANIRMVLRSTSAKPIVYMTKKLDKAAFVAMYKAIGYDLPGEIMVKVHTGEGRTNNKYYIKPDRMSSLVNQVNGTIVETSLGFTLAGFTRTNPAATLQLSKDHGFDTLGQGLDILDKDGAITLPVVGGSQLKGKVDVGANFKNYQSSLVLSHFKGHGIAGFGGAVKNIGIGFASPAAKLTIHNGGTPTTQFTMNTSLTFQKGMVEAAKAVNDALGGNLVYINTVDNLTLECDCDDQSAAPEISDICILGSLDPVALDQASCDLVLAATGGDKLKKRIKTDLKGLDGLKYGEQIGLGKIEYELKSID
jgi:uncharacterized Fe-S center protein